MHFVGAVTFQLESKWRCFSCYATNHPESAISFEKIDFDKIKNNSFSEVQFLDCFQTLVIIDNPCLSAYDIVKEFHILFSFSLHIIFVLFHYIQGFNHVTSTPKASLVFQVHILMNEICTAQLNLFLRFISIG